MTPRARSFFPVFAFLLLSIASLRSARADQSADCANPWWKDYPTDRGRTYTVTIENVTGGNLTLNFTRYYSVRDPNTGRCVSRTAPYPNATTTYTIAAGETRTLTLGNYPGYALRIRLVAGEGNLNVYEERQLGSISLSVYNCDPERIEGEKGTAALDLGVSVPPADLGEEECSCDCPIDSQSECTCDQSG